MKTLPQNCEYCFQEFIVALEDLGVYIRRASQHSLTESQARELIIHFEVAHELALKVIQKYFEKQGKGPFSGSRDTTVEAFHAELIDDGKLWLDMIIDRIQYNPIYSMDIENKFIHQIQKSYWDSLIKFEQKMKDLLDA